MGLRRFALLTHLPKMQKQISPVNSKAIIAYAKQEPEYKKALDLAKKLYQKDRRQYTGIEYLSHPLTVGSLLLDFAVQPSAMVVSALEDVLVRTTLTEQALREQFGDAIADKVVALTAPKTVTPETLQVHIKRLQAADPDVKTVKLASLLDHICSIPANKLKHAAGYLADCKALLPALEGGNAELMRRVTGALRRAAA